MKNPYGLNDVVVPRTDPETGKMTAAGFGTEVSDFGTTSSEAMEATEVQERIIELTEEYAFITPEEIVEQLKGEFPDITEDFVEECIDGYNAKNIVHHHR